jgi:dihydroneopterin aldolase
MQDRLIIKDLVVEALVGVYEWEQEHPQNLWVDLELSIDAAKAAARDDVAAAVDYGRLVSAVKQHLSRKPFRLLETVAEELAAVVLNEFATPEVTVRVKKRSLPSLDFAAVEVTRSTSR